jgi:hypothetical protein
LLLTKVRNKRFQYHFFFKLGAQIKDMKERTKFIEGILSHEFTIYRPLAPLKCECKYELDPEELKEKGPMHHSKTFMFCACFSAFHLFNKKLSCIWKFIIESNGVFVNFEIEKCSELAASLELYRPGADLRLQ